MLLLSVPAENFDRLLREYPQVEAALQTTSEMRMTARFLKQVSPFTTLQPSRARWLATRLERRSVPEGREILREGNRGDACYPLRQGEVEVVMRDQAAGGQRQLARLGPGALFGEAALLTQVPRNATVRSVAPCELLVLRRADLLEAMASDDRAAARVVEQVGLHDRPRRVAGVVSHQRAGQDGETIITLKHPQRGLYHRVGDDGWFVWEQLDGQHTLEEVSRAYRARYPGAPPQAVADLIRDLTAAGLVEAAALRSDVVRAVPTLTESQPKRGFFRHLLQRKG
jgi:CRP-like cAMP-binding protein